MRTQILTALAVISLFGCGGGGGADPVPAATGQQQETSSSSQQEAKPPASEQPAQPEKKPDTTPPSTEQPSQPTPEQPGSSTGDSQDPAQSVVRDTQFYLQKLYTLDAPVHLRTQDGLNAYVETVRYGGGKLIQLRADTGFQAAFYIEMVSEALYRGGEVHDTTLILGVPPEKETYPTLPVPFAPLGHVTYNFTEDKTMFRVMDGQEQWQIFIDDEAGTWTLGTWKGQHGAATIYRN
ncbi:MAG: hypothetical protein QM766_24085 [Burkholderiaceae bacterium]